MAIEELAKLLYWKIEHLAPGDDPEFVPWEGLEAPERELWRQGIKFVLRHGSLLAAAAPYTGLPATT